MKKKIILKDGGYAELLHFVVVSNIVHAVVITEDNRIDVVHHRDITFPETVEEDNDKQIKLIPEIEYKEKLSSKTGNKHFDTGKTVDYQHSLEKSLEVYKKKLQVAKKALKGIIWQEDVNGVWDYPETIASNALEKMDEIDEF